MQPGTPDADPSRTMTLEAFADTIIPGEKRSVDDRAVAGADADGGAVAAGAIELLEWSACGLADALDGFAGSLNEHAHEYAKAHALALDDALPAFVSLPFEHRTALVRFLTDPDHPEKPIWVALAIFSTMAFDSAAQMSTTDALSAGHPGLLTIGYAPPEADGLWRFPRFSYGRPLASLHPNTTTNGSPA